MLSVPPGAALEERVPRVLPPDAITASNWGVMSKNGRSLCTDLRVYPPNLDGRFDWMWRTTQEAFYGRMRIGSTGWLNGWMEAGGRILQSSRLSIVASWGAIRAG